ncbi:MAG: GGDEF domain-containing protein [Actinomycetota bacterium]
MSGTQDDDALRAIEAHGENFRGHIDAEAAAERALHDPLTGLPRTTIALDRLRGALSRAERSQHTAAVLVFGLNGVAALNDELGWEAGDEMLRRVATRLLTCLRTTDVAARIGGDKFAVICDSLDSWEDAASIAERLDNAIAAPMMVADRLLVMTSCVGVAVTADGTDAPEALLERADRAMQHDREKNGGAG